jgi:hypothetical protein
MKHSQEPKQTVTRDAAPRIAEAPPPTPVNTSRRRFTQVGLSTSVVMTLASRPAAASFCSHSGSMSGNLSRPGGGTCYGLTPGYWKNHPESWSCGYDPGLCNPLTKQQGTCKDYWFVTWGELKQAKSDKKINWGVYNEYKSWANWGDSTPLNAYPMPSYPPTTVGSAFAGCGLSFSNPSQTMMQAFWDPPEDIEPRTFLAHACAALLNVCRFGEDGYGYTKDGLLQFIRDWTGSLESLKNALQDLNERGGS